MANETPQMKAALKDSERGDVENSDWFSVGGKPMVQISCAASELIPTQQYANIVVGPVRVTRFVEDGDDDHLGKEISRTQALCEAAVAEERQTIVTLLRARASQ